MYLPEADVSSLCVAYVSLDNRIRAYAIPEDFLPIGGRDRNRIYPGSGIIVILNAD